MNLPFKLIILLLLAPVCLNLQAQEILAARQALLIKVEPDIERHLVRVMNEVALEHDFDFNFELLPSERSFTMLSRGDLPFNFARQPSAVANVPDLIQISTPVTTASFWLLTNSLEKCQKLEDLAAASLVGFLGLNLLLMYLIVLVHLIKRLHWPRRLKWYKKIE